MAKAILSGPKFEWAIDPTYNKANDRARGIARYRVIIDDVEHVLEGPVAFDKGMTKAQIVSRLKAHRNKLLEPILNPSTEDPLVTRLKNITEGDVG